VDLKEKRQLEVVRQMAKVKARARPWRSIIAFAVAVAGVVAVDGWGWSLRDARSDHPLRDAQYLSAQHATGTIIVYSGAAAVCIFGAIAALGLSGKLRDVLRPIIGSSHAAVVRYALVLVSAIIILLTTLHLVRLPVGQLVVGGALTGVLIGIAAQQALANLFAGMVLLFAHPFNVGDQVWIRSGALSGTLEGTVTEISITYVRLDTNDGLLALPNSLVLAAVVGPAGKPAPQPVTPIAWQPGNPVPADLSCPPAPPPAVAATARRDGAAAARPAGPATAPSSQGASQPDGSGAPQPGGQGASQPDGSGAPQPGGQGEAHA
jgi:hypothetical protein